MKVSAIILLIRTSMVRFFLTSWRPCTWGAMRWGEVRWGEAKRGFSHRRFWEFIYRLAIGDISLSGAESPGKTQFDICRDIPDLKSPGTNPRRPLPLPESFTRPAASWRTHLYLLPPLPQGFSTEVWTWISGRDSQSSTNQHLIPLNLITLVLQSYWNLIMCT